MKSILTNVSRVFLAVYFLLPGIGKFTSWDMHITLMETHNMIMVPFLLAVSGIAQIGGSILLLLNRQVVVCALGFAVMTILINLNNNFIIICLIFINSLVFADTIATENSFAGQHS